MHGLERGNPLVVGQEHLGDVAGHDGQVDQLVRRRSRERGGVAVDPSHTVASGLRPRDVERGRCRVEANDVDAAHTQPARELAGTAPDVEHSPGAELADDRLVVVEVVAIAFELVVDPGEARMVEDRVGHEPTPYVAERNWDGGVPVAVTG